MLPKASLHFPALPLTTRPVFGAPGYDLGSWWIHQWAGPDSGAFPSLSQQMLTLLWY
jgi:hypothetical protein